MISTCYNVSSTSISFLSYGLIKTISGTVYSVSRVIPTICRAIPNIIKGLWFLIFNAGALIIKGLPLLGRAILYLGSLVFKAVPIAISAIFKAAIYASSLTPAPIISLAIAILTGALLYLSVKTGAIKVITKLVSCSCKVIVIAAKIASKMGQFISKAISQSGRMFKMAGKGITKIIYIGTKSVKDFCIYSLYGLMGLPYIFRSNSYSIEKLENRKLVQLQAIRSGIEKASGSQDFERGLVKEIFEFLQEPSNKDDFQLSLFL